MRAYTIFPFVMAVGVVLAPSAQAASGGLPTQAAVSPGPSTRSAQARLAEARIADARSAHARPTQARPAHARPAHAQPAHARPTQARPAQARPAHAQPAHLQPAQAGSGSPTAATSSSAPAVAGVQRQRLVYSSAPGQANRLTVTMRAGTGTDLYSYTVDDVYPIRATAGCRHPVRTDATKVVCSLDVAGNADPFYAGLFYLGDRNDTVRFHNLSGQEFYASQFWLGDGDDRAVTRADQPEPGQDGHDGSSVYGQNGDDQIETGPGGDLSFVMGGNNDDLIRVYGEGIASGGNGNDKIYGTFGIHTFNGDDGNDLIDAGDGDDVVYGGRGNDRLWGRQGNDTIYGNSGDDQLHGGLGTDNLHGGPGRNVIDER
ncbi:Ca2+-binding RTX toxin-like protein [Kineosporia succinea]|uniref:Ca2+-binding RTX toxin-like protein n=1 Tax=Kineosporia succinea TaxID=84632 RepID=A0ABT9PEV6_9ACTN|nr:calcium-binding protein [Kineosporia succinea]MDP9831237.1 Ca2+-binding RTX toxin-like protein [Kineosporia succinea]